VNLIPAGGAVLRWSDAGASGDHFDAQWHFLEAGKIKLSDEIDYTRTKPEEVVKSESTSDNPPKKGEETHAIPITDL
jgi:hypothetical protein